MTGPVIPGRAGLTPLPDSGVGGWGRRKAARAVRGPAPTHYRPGDDSFLGLVACITAVSKLALCQISQMTVKSAIR